MTSKKSFATTALLCLMSFAGVVIGDEPQDETPPTSLAELETAILEVLEETGTPGISIAVVSRDENLWVTGLGRADVARDIPADGDTLFRIGSTSKAFVSFSILQLVEQGRLSLDDRVRDLIPEIEFRNPWEDTHPLRVVHLLEHTAGFDDIHLVEFAHNDPTPVSLKEALDYHPHSRTSRWPPGTRFAYCNAGPPIAAYIVQKVTGQPFEDYVQAHLFDPIGMQSATYFRDATMTERGATLYAEDGKTPRPYWHISMRPSGSINASARDMAAYLRMHLNGAAANGMQIVSDAALKRMRTPTTTLAARQGMQAGYGLSSYTTTHGQHVFHGHNGGVDGGLTEMAYLPDNGLGYAFMINSGNGRAFLEISELIRAFLTHGLEPPPLPPESTVPADLAAQFSGFYRPASLRVALSRFMARLLQVNQLTIDGSALTFSPLLGGGSRAYVAVSDRLARRQDRPLTSLALLTHSGDETLIQVGGLTYERTPAWMVWGELGLYGLSLLLLASTLPFALVWLPRRWFGKLRGQPHLSVRAWPLLTALSGVAFVLVILLAFDDAIWRLGRVTPYSVAIFATSLLLAVTALWSLWVVWRSRRTPVNRGVWWHSMLVSLSACTLVGYMGYWGLIGIRTWS